MRLTRVAHRASFPGLSAAISSGAMDRSMPGRPEPSTGSPGPQPVDLLVTDAFVVSIDAETVYRGVDAAAQAVLDRMGYRTPRRWPHIS